MSDNNASTSLRDSILRAAGKCKVIYGPLTPTGDHVFVLTVEKFGEMCAALAQAGQAAPAGEAASERYRDKCPDGWRCLHGCLTSETCHATPATEPAAPGLDALLTQILNRRVTVEQKLWNIAAGKIPVPDADGFRALAIELGTPTNPPKV